MTKLEMLAAARERFFTYVDQRADDECWPWRGGKSAGYGWFYVGGGRASNFSASAHRVALHFATGDWGRVARHSCDNPICCNPKHLLWGSHQQNSQDAIARRRAYVGEANSNAKLTDHMVRTMRAMRSQGALLRAIAAVMPEVTMSTVSKVCRGEIWAHV